MTTPTETNTPHGPGEVPEPPASEHARKAARHVEWDAAPDAVRPASASALVESSAPRYPGTGTRGDPFVVDWDLGDAENPYNWSTRRKWAITSQVRAPSSSSSCVVLGGADGVVLLMVWCWGAAVSLRLRVVARARDVDGVVLE